MQIYEQSTHYTLVKKQQPANGANASSGSEAFDNLVSNMSSLTMAGPSPVAATVTDAIKEAFWHAFNASVQNVSTLAERLGRD